MTEITADRALAALVPINALRNAALLAIRTPLVAMIDVDLAVSDSLQNVLQNADRWERRVAPCHSCKCLSAYVESKDCTALETDSRTPAHPGDATPVHEQKVALCAVEAIIS